MNILERHLRSHLQDHASAGFIWRLVDAKGDVETIATARANLDHAYGTRSSRVAYVRFNAPGAHRLVFEHVRPWSHVTLVHIEIDVDNHGREREGYARRVNLRALEQAV